RAEEARALEVGRDHAGDVATELRLVGVAADEGGDGDRQRLRVGLGEVDDKGGLRGKRNGEEQEQREESGTTQRAGNGPDRHERSFVLKRNWRFFHRSYLSSGTRIGVSRK